MRRVAALTLLLAAPAAWPDVVLDGSQHLGDDASAAYTPSDPVTRAQFSANPSHFELSADTTITAIRFDNAVFEVAPTTVTFTVDGTTHGGSLAGGTWTPNSAITLAAGAHSLAPDTFCLTAALAPTTACTGADTENDASWSSLTLIGNQPSLSQNFNRRRHLGDFTETGPPNSNLYYGGTYYPDTPDGAALTVSFTLDRNRRLSAISLYHLRDVETTNDVVAVDGTQVAALTGNGTPYVISPNLFLLAGTHTLQVAAGVVSGSNLDDFSWDDVVLTLVNDPVQTPGRFNAVDTGSNAVSGVIQTKEAGTTFALDLVALDATGTAALTNYIGDVVVELLNAGDDSGAVDGHGCRTSWSVAQSLGTVSYTAADNGRKSVAIAYNDALKAARVRQTDTVLGVSGCSADAFAIRPAYLGSAVASDANWQTAGTVRALTGLTSTSAATHKAGRPFTLQVTGYTSTGAIAAGYTASPAPAPTVTATTSLLGANTGVASASGWTGSGTLRSDNAAYSEAGAVRVTIADEHFADVDLADTALATRAIPSATADIGRFVPDHFEASLNDPILSPGCGDITGNTGFTYAGQPFGFHAGDEPTITFRATAAGGGTTTNYDGTLYKLPASAGPATYAALNGTLDASAAASPDNSIVNQHGGAALMTINPGASALQFTRAGLTPPFDAEIAITPTVPTDSDGVTYGGAPLKFGDTAPGDGVAFSGDDLPNTTNKTVRFGRLAIDNAYGSEKLPLDVPLRAEYYQESSGKGWVTAAADSCTSVPAASIALGPGGISGSTSIGAGSVLSLSAGTGKIQLTAPNVTGEVPVSIDLGAAGLPWLLGDWDDGNGVYAENPRATATFGVYKNGSDRRIFLREVVP